MDGNGRWAQQKGLPRIEGHRRGAETVKKILTAAQEAGVSYLTLYAFSVENWNRPKDEIDGLMKLLDRFLKYQLKELKKRKCRLNVIGRQHELPDFIQKRLEDSIAETADYDQLTLTLALNYGARTELIDAIKAIAQKAKDGSIDLEQLDYPDIGAHLYTADLPDPDLIIRTSGEYRLSNFLLMQSAYSEIHFSKVLWPDFDAPHFQIALEDYASRERRFGKTGAQIKNTPK